MLLLLALLYRDTVKHLGTAMIHAQRRLDLARARNPNHAKLLTVTDPIITRTR